jgi:hypothetical protein
MLFNNWNNVSYGAVSSAALDAGQAEELAKTMSVGHPYAGAASGMVGGAALQNESIDATLKSVTYQADSLVMWPSIPQDRAYSLVEQFNRTNSYGDGGSPFVPESGSPQMQDWDVQRHSNRVVFLATRRGVSLPATMVRMNAGQDLESKESEAGTLWLLQKLETELYRGLADFSNAGAFDGSIAAIPAKQQNLALDGIERQIVAGDQDYTAQAKVFDGFGANQSVISDLQGALISETTIEDLANVLVEQFSRPNELHTANKAMSDFVKQFFPKERVTALGLSDGARAGYVVKTMATTAGDIALKTNTHLRSKQTPKSQNDRPGVPAAPASATATPVTPGTSQLAAGANYIYEVSACNEQGEGASTAVSSQVTIANSGDTVSLAIGAPAAGNVPSHYAVYRTNSKGAGVRQFIGFCAYRGATTTFIDAGGRTEGAQTAYMLDIRPENLVWKQLAPLMKVNLAQVSLAKEWILLLAGTAIVFAPRRLGLIKNIGRA